jgi:ATP-dependent RNA helicase DHX29
LHLKRLREEFAQALSLRMSGKQFNEDQAKWFELGLKCLMTPPTPKEETIQRIGVQIK